MNKDKSIDAEKLENQLGILSDRQLERVSLEMQKLQSYRDGYLNALSDVSRTLNSGFCDLHKEDETDEVE